MSSIPTFNLLNQRRWWIQKINEGMVVTIKKTVFKKYSKRQNSFSFVFAEENWKKIPKGWLRPDRLPRAKLPNRIRRSDLSTWLLLDPLLIKG
jgi:hypothetical protein